MRGTSASPSLDCRNPSLLDKGRHHINAMTSGLEMPPFTDFLPLKFRLSIERVVILYYIVQFVVATWGPTYIPQLYLVILRAMPLIWFWYDSPVSGWCSETPIKGLSLASLTSAKSALNYYVCRFVPISVQRFVDVRTNLYKLSYWSRIVEFYLNYVNYPLGSFSYKAGTSLLDTGLLCLPAAETFVHLQSMCSVWLNVAAASACQFMKYYSNHASLWGWFMRKVFVCLKGSALSDLYH